LSDDTSRDAALVEFSGPMTVRQIKEAHERLQTVVAAGGAVVVDVTDVAACDLSFVQLLESARLSCGRSGDRFALSAPAAGPLRDVLERGGFLDGADADRTQFWTHAGAAQ
jgi:anti-anti-sigma regulatory factor